MASSPNQHLVLAFFESEPAADGAADALRSWVKANPKVHLEAIGVLAQDEAGQVKQHKLGPRQARKGIGVGAVLGAVAAVLSGGVSLIEGVAVGGAGGGLVGSLFHKGLGMTEDDVARISARLDSGHAALGALVPANQAPSVSAELEALGGEPEVHAVEQVEQAAEPSTATATSPPAA
jgi:uncharacterized membrane protein